MSDVTNQVDQMTKKEPEEEMTEKPQEKEPKENKKKKIGKVKIILIIIAVVIAWLIAVQIMAAEKYDMLVIVKEEEGIMGVNPLTESLDFGDLSRNLGSTRYITMKNSSGKDRFVQIFTYGDIASMIKTPEKKFVLLADEEKKLAFDINIPPSAEIKQYQGKVLIFRWPKVF